MTTYNKSMLIILDGVGYRKALEHNAVAMAKKPFLDRLLREYPTALLKTSGNDVGLPNGQMGNSEVGHMNLGAGRIVWMDLVRIDNAVEKNLLRKMAVFEECFAKVRKSGGKLHVMGLTSDGGVHSHYRHGLALVQAAVNADVDPAKIMWHAFTDGRDTAPTSGAACLAAVQAGLVEARGGRIATVIGRYYAMDRDKRWERVKVAYDALTAGEGAATSDAVAALTAAYAAGETDEFVKPIVVTENGAAIGKIEDGDAVIFFNFRSDRAREITRAFNEVGFGDEGREGFARKAPALAAWVCMTEYDKTYGLPIAFPPQSLAKTLGEVVAGLGLAQLRIAETEKYPHVTFFFNGGVETPNAGEERILVPSPRDVPTYDFKPEMSAGEVTEKLVAAIEGQEYGFVLCNYANGDMVGHTGVEEAAVKAVETVDACLARVLPVAWARGYDVLVTADHGNCEMMVDPATGGPHTSHTTGPVNIILASERLKATHYLVDGVLADVAPTLLEMMGVTQPSEMTGETLLRARG